MNVLLIGGGGREHALAWSLAQSPTLGALYAAPGNPGIAEHATCVVLDIDNHAAVFGFCVAHAITLVIVGPEGPLVEGLGDALRLGGIAVFGPDRAAAALEGSKRFTKALCDQHGVPTARYSSHDTAARARQNVSAFGYPVVVKADGLAAGKGVVIAQNKAEALAAIDAVLAGEQGPVVIEEFLTGEEVSLFALSDGQTVVAFGNAQDHKRIGDGDTGPNTGGMGAYSPAPILTPALEQRAMDEIVRPTIAAMAARGTPFVGVLYAGLMLTADGPKLIEYNVRFGDPEAQVLLPRFEGDLVALLHAVATGRLAEASAPSFSKSAAVAVVFAAPGYPGVTTLGAPITIGPLTAGARVFLAGVRQDGSGLITAGGRVLAVTALGDTVSAARDIAYANVTAVFFEGAQYRRDIGWRALTSSR